MLKIGITGHSKGIGKALADGLSEAGHDVMGFSRSNGFDIINYDQIAQAVEDSDVFINNAWSDYYQVDLLNAVFNKWRDDESKTIVNISSLAKYTGLSDNLSIYTATKAALSHQALKLMFKTNRKCKIININPGYVDTEMVEGKDFKMLTPKETAETIMWAINQPRHIEVVELSFWRPLYI